MSGGGTRDGGCRCGGAGGTVREERRHDSGAGDVRGADAYAGEWGASLAAGSCAMCGSASAVCADRRAAGGHTGVSADTPRRYTDAVS